MNRTKRLLTLLVALITILTLIGCGSTKQETQQPPQPTQQPVQQTSAPEEKTPEPAAENVYENRTVTIIVPVAVGGETDLIIRYAETFLKDYFDNKINFVIENLPGASSTIGTTECLLNRPNDGMTILITLPSALLFQPHHGDVAYTLENAQPVCQLVTSPQMLLVPEDSRFQTAADVLDFIRDNPGEFTYGVGGTGGIAHMAFYRLLKAAGLEENAVAVPISGSSEIYVQCMGGHISSYVAGLQKAYTAEGIKCAINLGSPSDREGWDSYEQASELGYGEMVTDTFAGIYMASGTDQKYVKAMADAFAAICQDPEFVKMAESTGFDVAYIGTEEFTAKCSSLNLVYRDLLQELGMIG